MVPVLIAAVLGLIAVVVAVRMLMTAPAASGEMLRRLHLIQAAAVASEPGVAVTDFSKDDLLSTIPWLNKWLATVDLAASFRKIISQADLDWSVGKWLIISLGLWLGSASLLFLRFWSVLPTVAFSLLFLPLPTLYVFHRRSARFAKFEEQLPDALYLLVSALRVGHSLMTAIGFLGQESAEPLKGEFQQCFEEQNFGIDLRTALTNLASRIPVQDVQFFVAAVLIQKESGGNMAEVLESLSETMRDRFRLKKQARVFTAQGRATGWILTFLPVALGLVLYMVHPEGVSLLWTTDIGRKLLYTSIGMDILGGLIIRKIVTIRV